MMCTVVLPKHPHSLVNDAPVTVSHHCLSDMPHELNTA